jgi:hypothetical protein
MDKSLFAMLPTDKVAASVAAMLDFQFNAARTAL